MALLPAAFGMGMLSLLLALSLCPNSALTDSEVGLLLAVIVWSRRMTLWGHLSKACCCSLVLRSRGMQGDAVFPSLLLHLVGVV